MESAFTLSVAPWGETSDASLIKGIRIEREAGGRWGAAGGLRTKQPPGGVGKEASRGVALAPLYSTCWMRCMCLFPGADYTDSPWITVSQLCSVNTILFP